MRKPAGKSTFPHRYELLVYLWTDTNSQSRHDGAHNDTNLYTLYLSAGIHGRVLAALVGPVVVYQPSEVVATNSLAALAAQGLIEIRTPLTADEQRLKAALAEFTQWARQNPGRSTPGAGFIGSQQGKVPFFDESMISRIRSDIKQYGSSPADTDNQEAGFSARLFLAVAEENDRATAQLDHDLKRFKALEQGFLDSLVDSDVKVSAATPWDRNLERRPGRQTHRTTDSRLGHPGRGRQPVARDVGNHQRRGDGHPVGNPGRSDPPRAAGIDPAACFIRRSNAHPGSGAGRSGGPAIPGSDDCDAFTALNADGGGIRSLPSLSMRPCTALPHQ